MTSADVMNMTASLMNDTAKTTYTFSAMLPYLNMAMGELQELFELNNIPVTNVTTPAIIAVPANTVAIGFSTTPALPAALVEIQQIWESPAGEATWIPMARKEFLPHYLEGQQISQFLVWNWIEQEIRLLPANAANDLKLDYIKSLFVTLTDVTGAESIDVINSKSYLGYRTGGLCSEFIGENKTRADALNAQAELALQRSLGISIKGKQAWTTRRRPFRSFFKSRRIW